MSKQQPDKGLPCNIDAERLVLGSVLLDDAKYVEIAGSLQPDDFLRKDHQKIFTRMGDMYARREAIDRVTLAQELMRYGELDSIGGMSYLVSLDDGIPQMPNVDAYVKIVKDQSTLRRTIFASQRLINKCMDRPPVSEIHAGAEEILMVLGEAEYGDGPQTLGQVLDTMPGGINTFLGPQKKGLQTGFGRFDDMTGGLHNGDLILLAARPSMGKTAMALNIAQYAAVHDKKRIAVFSLEMSKEELLFRMVCSAARVDSQRVRLSYLNAEERRRLAAATSTLADAQLYVDDKSAATAPDVHARVRRLMAQGRVDLVVIDYLQLMSAGRTFESRNQEVTSISRGLKLMAKEIDAPVLALSQLSRAPELRRGNQRPQLSDLRESGSLEQDADVVAFIFREEVYAKDREDLRGMAELIVAKQRKGPIGTVNLVFLHNCTRFENRAEDIEPPLAARGGSNDRTSTSTD